MKRESPMRPVTAEWTEVIGRDAKTNHAATPEAALRGVLRKHAIAEAQYEMSDVTMKKAAKDPRKSKWIVRLSDARKIGACEFGIRSWCERTGLPYNQGRATFAQVYAAYQQAPISEARRTLIYVLRRNQRRGKLRRAGMEALAP